MRALVVVEHDTNAIRAASFSAAAFAEAVVAIAGGEIEILVLGHDIGALASRASKVAPVLVADHELLRYPIADRYAAVIADVVRSRTIDLIVAASTTFARDIVGRTAGLLGGSMASDVVGHEFRDGRLLLKRPMYAGAMLATIALAGQPQIITIRPSAYAPAAPRSAPYEVHNIYIDVATLSSNVVFEGIESRATTRPDLTEARSVVSGGRAFRDSTEFETYVGALADKLGGACGCTRALVDAGITPNELQVGQTGKVVAPELYIALGLSGSIQHLAGMKNSKVVVAINNDPEAPIFDVANYGLVADVREAVPQLIDELGSAQSVDPLFNWSYRKYFMDFELNAEQRELQNAAIEFARDELNDNVIERDADKEFSRAGWKKCADFGVMRLPIPEEHGGSGADPITTIAVMEGLGYGCRDQGLLFSINAHLWTNSIPILKYGTKEQIAMYMPGLCDGSLIGANGASEPGAGSDIFGMRTRVVRDGENYVLNGSKIWVTNATIADLFVSYGTLDPERGVMGICGFIVEKNAPGLSVGQKLDKMGLRTSPMAEIFFKDCRIPVAARLGREGFGAEVFNCSMAWERASILATCLGTMRRQLEKCVEYARARKQFGQSIGKFQSVANRIVDMQVRYETARLLLYKVGWLMQQGKSTHLDAALAKLYVSESFLASCLDAVQVHGTAGYMTELEFERELRDAVGSRLYSGTSEIQRNIIAKQLLRV